MSDLPDGFCELLVRRELEGLSYPELAGVMGVPVGTVLSGLTRAREAFRGALDAQLKQCGPPRERRAEASGCEEPGPDEQYRE
jgi:RNA polymerase sigma-70 factor (ECF subfamily)